MSQCDLCGDETAILYTVERPKKEGEDEFHLCKACLKTVHEAYVQIK